MTDWKLQSTDYDAPPPPHRLVGETVVAVTNNVLPTSPGQATVEVANGSQSQAVESGYAALKPSEKDWDAASPVLFKVRGAESTGERGNFHVRIAYFGVPKAP